MDAYLEPMKYAAMFFPIIALLITLPFMIHQYRKYGSIPFLRILIIYSFVLYLLVIYFLVILPLPTKESVANLAVPTIQIIPFKFIHDIVINMPQKGILSILYNNDFYIALFNLLMHVPFGIYLRYYCKQPFFKVILYSFLLSLFFELTQLSALYGIYSRPYRLFDIDDLLLNTLGGGLGYLVMPLFTCFLPTRDNLDKKSYHKGLKVSILRRFITLIIDVVIYIIIASLFSIVINIKLSNLFSSAICFIVIPLFKRQTIGQLILRVKVVNLDNCKTSWYKLLFRNFMSYILLFNFGNIYGLIDSKGLIIHIIIVIIFIIDLFLMFINKRDKFIYETLSFTKIVSIINMS